MEVFYHLHKQFKYNYMVLNTFNICKHQMMIEDDNKQNLEVKNLKVYIANVLTSNLEYSKSFFIILFIIECNKILSTKRQRNDSFFSF